MHTIYNQFLLDGAPVSCVRYGNGHINETYLLVTNRPHTYILQKLNSRVFPDIPGLMKNLIAVTEHLRRQDENPNHVLTLVPTLDGSAYLHTPDNQDWRLFEFVSDSLSLEFPETPDDFMQSGKAFGTFQNMLSAFPADTLTETIPHFHDTPYRYQTFHKAVGEDRAGRLQTVREEVEWFLAHEAQASALMDWHLRGTLPLRVTHNDTKLNNVLLHYRTRAPLCIIDLDTVMPGLAANDFGDSIRFGANTAAEDETDLDKVSLSMPMYGAYAKGFLESCGNRLSGDERESLPTGAYCMTLECGLRFLTDHLNGDVYFHIRRPGHNLDRARTQIRLVEDMERKRDEMTEIVQKYSGA